MVGLTRILGSVCLFGTLALVASAQQPVRVGILGVDNYQAVEYTAMFNNPKAEGDFTGLRVVAAYASPASPDIQESVDSLPKWTKQIAKHGVEFVDSTEELLKRVDVVMIMSLDGRKHKEQATAVLKAGKRLYVGRPLAASFEDAVYILKLAEDSKVPFWTSSQHRYSPGFSGMRNHPEVGKVLGADVYGGCVIVPHHSDLYWQSLHSIETLYSIMGPGCVTVSCASTPYAESVTGSWEDGRVGTYRGVKKGAVKWSATVFGEKGVSVAGIYGHGVPEKGIVPTKDKYMGYLGIGVEIAKFFKGGAAPVPVAETLEIFAFMEAAHESKKQNGAPIRIADILKKAGK